MFLVTEEHVFIGLELADRATPQTFRITLRAGAVTVWLPVGDRTPPSDSTSMWVLVRVLVDSGRRIVTRLLLKLVPNVA